MLQEATVLNVENYLGWTLSSSEFKQAIENSLRSAHV
jgi:hypothetical protein